MSPLEEKVLNALRQVEDPDLKKDLVTLGMVKDLKAEGRSVSFTVELTTPACPMKEMIHNACVNAVRLLVGSDLEISVNMSARVTQKQGSQGLPGVKNLIAVASGKGGVGKSTVAANLAIALAQTGSRVGLLDADLYGPSQPLMFGLLNERPMVQKIDGKDMMTPMERYGIQIMSIGFLVHSDQAVVWRGPMASNALRQLISDTLWNDLDYLVIDLPPGTGDIHITVSQQYPLTGAVIVTTPQPVAVADSRKAIGMFLSPPINVPLLGVVENMAYFTPPELPDKKYYIFGQGGGQQMAAEFGLPFLGSLPIEPAFREGGDQGRPAALWPDSLAGRAFAQLAAEVARQISIKNAG